MLFNRVSGINSYLITGGIPIFDAEVVVTKIHVQIGKDEFVTDLLPNNAGHFIAV